MSAAEAIDAASRRLALALDALGAAGERRHAPPEQQPVVEVWRVAAQDDEAEEHHRRGDDDEEEPGSGRFSIAMRTVYC